MRGLSGIYGRADLILVAKCRAEENGCALPCQLISFQAIECLSCDEARASKQAGELENRQRRWQSIGAKNDPL